MIFSQSTDWLFCAVNPPMSEGFTNLPNSLNISLDSVASAKESLILRFSLGLRAMSFGDKVCVNR